MRVFDTRCAVIGRVVTMQFIKIDTDIQSDPKIKILKKKHGGNGYFVYLHSLILVMENVSAKDVSCSLPYAAASISYDTDIDEVEVANILETCISLDLMEGDAESTIYIPKILWRLDYNVINKDMRKIVDDAKAAYIARKNENNVSSCGDTVAFSGKTTKTGGGVVAFSGIDKDIELDKDIESDYDISSDHENLKGYENTHTTKSLGISYPIGDESENQPEETACVTVNLDLQENPDNPFRNNYSKTVFKILQESGLPCSNGNSLIFMQREFYQALPYIHELHLRSDEVIQAVKNYAQVCNMPDTWWKSRQDFLSLCKSKNILKFIPGNFDIKQYENKSNTPKHGSMIHQLGLDQREGELPF